MTREEFARLVEERGGLAGQPVIVDPEIDNPDPATARRQPKIPNPNPKRTYIFNNGTQLEARGSGDELDAEGRPLEVQITDAGTALRPSAATSLEEGVSAPTDQRYIISRKPDGTLNTQENPNYKGDKDEKSTLQPFGNQLLKVNPDGSTTVIATKAADSKEPTTVAFGDTLYSFDGSKVTPLVTRPKEPEKPQTEVRNGVTYQWNPQTNSWSEAQGLPSERKPTTASVNTSAKYIVYYDDQGNEVSRNENPNYQPQAPTQLTADTVSPNIPLLKPDGTVEWVPNQNRVPASQAMQTLLSSVGVKVNGGNLSTTDAKDLLTGAVNVMNAQTAQATQAETAKQNVAQNALTAAGTQLDFASEGARTGAGMLQQRAQTAQGIIGQVLGLAGQGQRYGGGGGTAGLSGGMMAAPAGIGGLITQGASAYSAELLGGQPTIDAAARLVQQADPRSDLFSPTSQAAVGVIGQMFERYQQLTGTPHPAVAAQQAAQQSQQSQGVVAPQTAPAPAPEWQRADQMYGFTPPGNAMAPQPGLTGTVPPGSPQYLGFTAPVTSGMPGGIG